MLFGQNSWLNQDVLHIPQGTFFSLRSANDQLSFWTLAAWCCGKPYYSGAEPSVRLSFGTRNEFPVEQLQKVRIDMHPSVGAADTLHKDTLHKPLGFSGSFTKFHLQTKIHQLATERSLLCARQAKTTSHMLSQNMWTYVENIFKSLVLRLVTARLGAPCAVLPGKASQSTSSSDAVNFGQDVLKAQVAFKNWLNHAEPAMWGEIPIGLEN